MFAGFKESIPTNHSERSQDPVLALVMGVTGGI